MSRPPRPRLAGHQADGAVRGDRRHADQIKEGKLDEAAAEKLMAEKVVPKFLAVNKCPDFYEDKGHEFGKSLPMDDKSALIELLKTF
jgi:hypothetical protein